MNGSGGNGLIIGGPTGNNVPLTGGGTVALAGGYIIGSNGTQLLTNQETIQGAGGIGVNFDNQSLIDANGGSPLTISSSTATNKGTLEASGGGLLEFVFTTLNNTGGKIQALDGSVVQLDNSVTINGGTLTTTGSEVIRSFSNGPLLNGVTNSGTYQVTDRTNTALQGTITNTGAVQVNSTVDFAVLNMNGTVTLTEGGR